MKWSVGEEGAFVRRRFAAATYVDGVPTSGAAVDIAFPGTREPLPDDEIATLPEGERQSGQIVIICELDLRTADERAGILADHVQIDGQWYEVRGVHHYPRLIPHYEARVMKVRT